MGLRRRQPFGAAIVQRGVIEGAGAARSVVGRERLRERRRIEADLHGELFQRVRLGAVEHRRHEAADGFLVNDRPCGLARLLRHQATPDGVTLGPEILTLVVEAVPFAVHHHAQRNAVDPRADAAIVERRAGIDGDAMGLRRIADGIRPCSIMNFSSTP